MTVHVRGLEKRLGGRLVLDRVSFSCTPGEITILRGENGAGKSTLLALIARVLVPDRGLIDVRGRLGYVPEAANPPGHLSAEELFALVARLARAAPPDPALREALAVDPIARQPIERLSLGERRRVCVATALIGAPDILILDEPTNGLDTAGVTTLATLLHTQRTRGATILIATHDHDFATAVADRTLHLQSGRLSDPAPAPDKQ